MKRALLWVGLALAAGAAACVVEEEGDRERFADDGEGGAGAEHVNTTTGAGAGGSGAAGAGGGSTSGTGGSGSSSGVGAGPGCSYDPPNSCLSAETIEQIAGDTGTDLRSYTGRTGQFFKVFVAEAVSSAISYPDLKFAARLDQSAVDFDLRVYDGGAEPGCDGAPVDADDDPAVITGSWEDSLNSDDGRWVVFEVRYASGDACGADAEWTFTLAGNYDIRCNPDGVCNEDDDCVCPDCDADAYCSDASHCSDDATCDTYSEGCGCGDCAGTPACL
jgi:hypothetical protein